MAQIEIEDLLRTVSLEDVMNLATIKSAGMDLGTGKRDVELNDPLVYTDTAIEDVPLPDDLKYVTRGEGLRKKEYVGNKGRDELNFLQKVGLGIVDAVTDNKFDWDRADLVPKDEYNAKRLAERRRKAALGGDALPSPEQTRKTIQSQRLQADYFFEQLKQLNDYELERWKDAYPQYAKMINDEIFKRRMQVEYNSPSELQNRIAAGFNTRNATKLANAQAYALIANAMKTGLERKV